MGAPKQVTIYTRGISSPTRAGGYGVVLLCNVHRKELSGAALASSNNRMDIVAAIEGLKALQKRSSVTLYNTNTYLIDAMAKGWAERWRASGWINNGMPTPHAELWQELLSLRSRHDVLFAGRQFNHGGDEEYGRCDLLAHDAIRSRAEPIGLANGGSLGTQEQALEIHTNAVSEPQCCRNCGAPMAVTNGWCGSYYRCETCSSMTKAPAPKATNSSASRTKSVSARVETPAIKRADSGASPVAIGALPASSQGVCWACNGTGYVRQQVRCSTCAGKGRFSNLSSDAYDRYGRQLSDVPGYIYRDDRHGNRKRT